MEVRIRSLDGLLSTANANGIKITPDHTVSTTPTQCFPTYDNPFPALSRISVSCVLGLRN
jgi:hypothetical protein